MRLTNQILGDKWNENLAKVRRWTREFLGPDSRAKMQSGYSRELSLEEAFEVFLGGHLVSALKFEVHEAKTIIGDLRKWIKEKGLYPGKRYAKARREHPHFFHVHILRTWDSGDFYYELRELLYYGPDLDKGDPDLMMERYRIKVINPKSALPDWRNVRILGVTELLIDFNRRLKGEEGLPGRMYVPELLELSDDLEA